MPRWLHPTIIGLGLLYPALLLWPYRWEPPKRVANAAQLLPDGGVEFAAPGVVRTGGPPDWLETAIRTSQLDLSLLVRSALPDQSGPARILTISANHLRRNLTLGQEGHDLVLRLRTPGTSRNGTVDGRPVAEIPGVFRHSDWVDVAIHITSGELRITVGDEVRTRQALPPAPLKNWDDSFPLVLGNELSVNRPWLGSIRRAVIRTGDVAVDYATAPELLRRPSNYWHKENYPKLAPFQDSSGKDMALNLLLYLPLGFLLGLRHHRARWRGAIQAIGIVATLSATLEFLQLFVAVRNPSVDDFIFNTFGGAAGVALASAIAARIVGEPPTQARHDRR